MPHKLIIKKHPATNRMFYLRVKIYTFSKRKIFLLINLAFGKRISPMTDQFDLSIIFFKFGQFSGRQTDICRLKKIIEVLRIRCPRNGHNPGLLRPRTDALFRAVVSKR